MQSNLIKIYEITRTRAAITAHPRKIIGDFLSVTTIINTIHLSRCAGKKSFSDYTCDRFAPGISLAHFGGGNPDHLFRSAFPRGHAGSKSKRVYGSRTIQVKLVRGRAGERDGSQKGRRGSSSVAKDRGIELPTEFRLIQLAEEKRRSPDPSSSLSSLSNSPRLSFYAAVPLRFIRVTFGQKFCRQAKWLIGRVITSDFGESDFLGNMEDRFKKELRNACYAQWSLTWLDNFVMYGDVVVTGKKWFSEREIYLFDKCIGSSRSLIYKEIKKLRVETIFITGLTTSWLNYWFFCIFVYCIWIESIIKINVTINAIKYSWWEFSIYNAYNYQDICSESYVYMIDVLIKLFKIILFEIYFE